MKTGTETQPRQPSYMSGQVLHLHGGKVING